MKSGTVYRAYDAEGALLYVGCTTQPLRYRLQQHSKKSGWWPLHDRIEHDAPLPIELALRSESDQITLLRPRFNQNAGCVGTFDASAPTERDALEWKARYEAGATIEEIALVTRRSTNTVRNRLVALGTEMRRPGQRAGIVRLNQTNLRPAPSGGSAVHVASVSPGLITRRVSGATPDPAISSHPLRAARCDPRPAPPVDEGRLRSPGGAQTPSCAPRPSRSPAPLPGRSGSLSHGRGAQAPPDGSGR